jgi:hypothetical protein
LTSEERAGRAIRVRALIEDADVRDALAAIEADFIAEWKAARTTDERENCWRALDTMRRLLTYLNSYASSDRTAARRG